MKPIIFSPEMVRAILDHKKWMTRRVMKPQPVGGIRYSIFTPSGLEDLHGQAIKQKYYADNVLWVREAWRTNDFQFIDGEWSASIQFKADMADGIRLRWREGDQNSYDRIGWRPSIFMPKEAARLFLRVADVRVQRVQEIPNTDCIREGVNNECCRVCVHTGGSGCDQCNALWTQYRNLWDKLNAKRGYGWDSNPWVWAVSFEVLSERPE